MTTRSILRRSLINPFSVILISLAAISFITDVLFASNFTRNFSTFLILLTMYLVSAVIRFVQELKSKRTADYLQSLVEADVMVFRDGQWVRVISENLKTGDVILLEAGMRIPRDIRVSSATDLYVSESAITGESDVFEKLVDDTCRLGTIVVGGKGEGVICDSIPQKPKRFGSAGGRQSFDKGAASIAAVLLRYAIVLIPLVFLISLATKGDVLRSFLFSLSVGVGLIPEMLPMVANACLAHGSSVMGKRQTVVKNINAMQSFASLDVLCVDKTGTLTGDRILLEYYMDVLGNENSKVLAYAYLNSLYNSAVKNHLDNGILEVEGWNSFDSESLVKQYAKVDSLPFDYKRKTASVLVGNRESGRKILIVKGGVDEILLRCRNFEYREEVHAFDGECRARAIEMTSDMASDGMKLVAVAYCDVSADSLSIGQDESLTLLGFLAFFDAPKQSAFSAIENLKRKNISVRVLSGDKSNVTLSICRRLKLNTDSFMTGSALAALDDDEILQCVEHTEIFAELTPEQKSLVVRILKQNGHTVGFLGDGLNDLSAISDCDAGISVENSVDAVKECSNVILMKKDLNVLEEGISQGRKAFMNMMKYIRITASSNFGNIFSIVLASVLLPFFPMSALQLLLLNLLYDTLCLSFPWDNVDEDEYDRPLEWSGRTLGRFMMFFGPISSLFDIATFVFLYFVMCPSICGGSYASLSPLMQNEFMHVFQTGWFLESLWTQVLILLLLRTSKVPFIQSSPSLPFQIVMGLGIMVFTSMIYTPVGVYVGLCPLPVSFFGFLLVIVVGYLMLVTFAKRIYIRRNGKLC